MLWEMRLAEGQKIGLQSTSSSRSHGPGHRYWRSFNAQINMRKVATKEGGGDMAVCGVGA